jgi:hypothetical protein
MSQDTEPPSGSVASGGKIGRSGTAQTILAVSFLIVLTLASFIGVAIIGAFLGSSEATYWMIELVFALLCGGAGALVGGSADVRSTLNIPGSPVQARLGGAVAMVIVGFAVAYLGKPQIGEQTYSVQIEKVPHLMSVDNVEYSVVVTTADDDMSISRKGQIVTITIPSNVQMYKATVAVFTADRDSPKVFGRCALTFDSQKRKEDLAKEIVPDFDNHFRVALSMDYIPRVVKEARVTGHAVENEPCIEGRTATAKDDSLPLSGYFILVPTSTSSRVASIVQWEAAPAFAIMASAPSKDLPPTRSPGGGVISQEPGAPAPQGPPPVPNTSAGHGNTEHPPDAEAALSRLRAQVDAYVQGQNLDRTELYDSWPQVAGYVLDGFRAAVSNGSPLAARYVNLIANALNVIEGGKYLPPTVRPNWDQSIKPDRLANNIPGFQSDDYGRVVGLLCSTDADSKIAARRLLRLFPSNNFSQPIDNLEKQTNCDLVFGPETAMYYYYNRIVEYDGSFALDAQSHSWLEDNYKRGQDWLKLLRVRKPDDAVFGAMLDFGYAITLWDRSDAANKASALSYFNSMINTIRSSNGDYPSSKEHIAIALGIVSDPKMKSSTLDSATTYNSAGLYSISGNYVASGTDVALFALPETASKSVGQIDVNGSVRIYLRAGEWDLVQTGAQIGWAQRLTTSGKSIPRS